MAGGADAAAAGDAAAATGIAWRAAASDADIDAAFVAARAASKPVFMYWGAAWCPPCNQVKATLFNRHDFIERSRAYVAVYVDGDSPGAQKVGARFRVSGYPTMVLFSPQGQEITRLPGEVDPSRYTQVMTLALDAARPAKAVLAEALAGGSRLAANDWRLLSFYAWDTDEQQLVAKGELPETLTRLARAVPPALGDTAMRLRLKALASAKPASAASGSAAGAVSVVASSADEPAVLAMLASPVAAREQTDVLTNQAAEIVRALSAPGTPARSRLLAAYARELKVLEADASLSRADRMQALIAQVDLARIEVPDDASTPAPGKPRQTAPRLPATLLADVRAQAARADREITDGYERQAVITAAAYMLDHAGLGNESDALLRANLVRSHSPYYLMSQLAGNAKRRGDNPAAVRWYRQAYERSEGPATRLQWGATYVLALVDLAPADEASIEQAATQLLGEAAAQPDAFYERSGRSLKRVAARLQTWSQAGTHAAAMSRLQGRLDALCTAPGRSAAEQATCKSLLVPAGPAKRAPEPGGAPARLSGPAACAARAEPRNARSWRRLRSGAPCRSIRRARRSCRSASGPASS